MPLDRASLPEGLVSELVTMATRAPSGHNTQPWTFEASGRVITVVPDYTRRLPVVDPDDHALFISLGCAVENLAIAARARGFSAEATIAGDRVVVSLAPAAVADRALAEAIPLRQSNRRRFDGAAVPAAAVEALHAAAASPCVRMLSFRTSEPAVEPLIALVREASRAQFEDRRFVDELVSWIRFSRRELRSKPDGLTSAGLGFPSVPRWLGRLIMTKLVTPAAEANRQERAIRSSGLLLCFVVANHDVDHWIALGRAFERVALTAARAGLALAHANMPCELEPVRRRLAALLHLGPAEQPLLLVRLGTADAVPRSPRRPASAVLRYA